MAPRSGQAFTETRKKTLCAARTWEAHLRFVAQQNVRVVQHQFHQACTANGCRCCRQECLTCLKAKLLKWANACNLLTCETSLIVDMVKVSLPFMEVHACLS